MLRVHSHLVGEYQIVDLLFLPGFYVRNMFFLTLGLLSLTYGVRFLTARQCVFIGTVLAVMSFIFTSMAKDGLLLFLSYSLILGKTDTIFIILQIITFEHDEDYVNENYKHPTCLPYLSLPATVLIQILSVIELVCFENTNEAHPCRFYVTLSTNKHTDRHDLTHVTETITSFVDVFKISFGDYTFSPLMKPFTLSHKS